MDLLLLRKSLCGFLKYSLYFWIFVLQCVNGCPNQCECDQQTVNCSWLGLRFLPDNIPEDTRRLILTGNNFTHSSFARLVNQTSVEYLDLSYSQISQLEAGVFQTMTRLQTINLAGNHLAAIDDNTFTVLTLEELIIDNNSMLNNINIDAFKGSNIRSISMNNCSIEKVDPSHFQPLKNSLKQLYISFNSKPILLGENLLYGFNLEEVVMRKSGISAYMFLYSSSVKRLDLSDNPIGNRAWYIVSVTKIGSALILRNISTTMVVIFSPQSSLNEIDVANNKIATIDSNSFSYIPNLETFTLSGCQIEDLPADFGKHLQNVTNLSLSGNKLHRVQSTWFSAMSKIKYLDLSYNLIQYLTVDDLFYVKDVNVISLEGNPIHCNCESKALVQWAKVRAITASCGSPIEVTNKNLSAVHDSDLVCSAPIAVFSMFEPFGYGYPFGIYCAGKGDPPPNVTVTLPNRKLLTALPSGRGYEQVSVEQAFPAFNCSMGGTYMCEVTNFMGKQTKTVSFTKICYAYNNNPDEYYFAIDAAVDVFDPDASNISLTTPNVTLAPGNSTDVETTPIGDVQYIIAIVVIAFVLLTVVLLFICYCCKKRKVDRYDVSDPPPPLPINIIKEPDWYYLYKQPDEMQTSI